MRRSGCHLEGVALHGATIVTGGAERHRPEGRMKGAEREARAGEAAREVALRADRLCRSPCASLPSCVRASRMDELEVPTP